MVKLVLIATVLGCGSHPSLPTGTASDPSCTPPGVPIADLEPRRQNLMIRRVLACNDRHAGRISDAEYRRQIAALDAELAQLPDEPPSGSSPIEWASSVIDVSSQYSDGAWAAEQVLGPPDVFPNYGDTAKAWASQGADDPEEWIEVGFERASSISEVEIYETYNPGAIDRIELVTAHGRRIDAVTSTFAGNPSGSMQRRFSVRCTAEPIVAVRVHLDSLAVAGWNELDAIGVVPCTR